MLGLREHAICLLHTEVEALLNSIKIAADRRRKKVKFCLDSLTLSKAVHGGNQAKAQIRDTVYEIRVLQAFESWDFV